MAVFISFAAINVQTLNRGCSIAVGEVAQTGWTQNGKNNFANGQLFGSNLETGFWNNLADNDLLDSPISELQPSSSVQSQSV